MGSIYLKVLKLVLLFSVSEIFAIPNDISFSVIQVTSKSMSVRWSHYSGASSYKVTATPVNSLGSSVFAQFSGNTVMGSVNSLFPNTVYNMQVEAMDNLGHVLGSAALDMSTAPPVPTINQAYSKQSDSMTVEFNEVPGASSYILRAESPVGDFFLETPVAGSPGTVQQLSPYTDYNLSVMSVNSAGRSQPSLDVQGKTGVASPRLMLTSPTNDSILVTWPLDQHIALYTITLITQGSNSNTTLTFNTTDPFMTFSNLEPGTTYCIKAKGLALDGLYGDEISVWQITRPPSPVDIQVSVNQGRSGGLTVYWQLVHGADVYIVRATSGQNCSASETTCIISPLLCGQNHSVTVTAVNSAGPSNPSGPENFMTFPCPPDHTWIEEPAAGSCMVGWTETALVDYYTAFIKRDDGVEDFCNTTDTICHFQCLCGYAYLSTVFAYNEAGTSPPGELLNYTTIPCCPEAITIALVSTETLEITWSPVRGVEFYETTAVETADVVHCKDTSPVCALSDLRCNGLYQVVVTPCSEIGGCNHTCKAFTHETDPCSPTILSVTQNNSSSNVSVLYTAPNTPNTTYTITAVGVGITDTHTCQSNSTSCQLTHLPCGATYDVTAYASTAVGQSLPSFSVPLETGPCCPTSLTVNQVTQAMTNVTWSNALGASTYVTSLTSSLGHARCHTMDTHCLMGCITCGTNYSVSLEAFSRTGHMSECSYHGFSSSSCCPSNVKLYRMANSSVRIFWRSTGPQTHTVDVMGTVSNYTCVPAPLSSFCDLADIMCEDLLRVLLWKRCRTGCLSGKEKCYLEATQLLSMSACQQKS
ncbi:hypothetical protein DPEC_G00059960 [Dallia pectoralis]|uniref:Uncharacterized protein n=1 Tax=Dallia pectoralis TaxID=75939 RepID=A0ACC2H6X0_DALPE|nr:hypothetical protein DPEC_G00059960 [Dallia pectoralis]